MGILEANLAALKAKDGALAARLAEHPGPGVEVVKARIRGRTFEYQGRRFVSGYDPVAEARLQAEELISKGPDSVVLFGLGCGDLVANIAERKKKAKVIVYEPSLDILKGVLSAVDLSRVLKMERVFLCADLDELVATVREQVEGIEGLVGYQTVPYKLTFPGKLIEYQRKVKNAHTTNRLGVSTAILSFDMWLENYFANLEHLLKFPPVDSLSGRFKGVPMVIVGAGPSLDRNIHLLKEIKGKAVIIAAVTAYKSLLKAGVIPDIVIAAEKVDLPEYFTYGEEDRQTRFLLGEASHPNMYGRDVKGIFIYYNLYMTVSVEQAEFFGSSFFPQSGGSVTTSALDIGSMFGCDPIIMIGQDLAFGAKRAYSKESIYISQEIKIDRDAGKVRVEEKYVKPDLTVGELTSDYELLWLKGLDGKPIPTKYDWVTFHQWFESAIERRRKNGDSTVYINATEGGAYVEGMEHITLKEAIERHVTRAHPIEETLAAAEAERARSKPRVKELLKSVEAMRASLADVTGLAAEIVGEAKGLDEAFRSRGFQEWFDSSLGKIRRLEDKLHKRADGARFLWDLVVHNTYVLKKRMIADENADASARFSEELGTLTRSYEAIGAAASKFTGVLDDAIARLKELKKSTQCCGGCGGSCDDGPKGH